MITDADIKKLSKVFLTKKDSKRFLMKDDSKKFLTKDDSKKFATKDDLKKFATKDDLKRFATKKDLEEVKSVMATKSDLSFLEARMNKKFEGMDQRFEWVQSAIERLYTLLDTTLGNQRDFKVDFALLDDQVQRHEKILEGYIPV